MLRFCPKKVKEKFKIGKFEILDVVGLFIAGVIVLVVMLFNGIPTSIKTLIPKLIISIVVGLVGFVLNYPFDADSPRLRSYILSGFKFLFKNKRYQNITLEKDLNLVFEKREYGSNEIYSLYNKARNQHMIAVEVKANLFLLKNEEEQDAYIDDLSKCLKYVKRGTILKVQMPINVGDYYLKNQAKQKRFNAVFNSLKYGEYHLLPIGKLKDLDFEDEKIENIKLNDLENIEDFNYNYLKKYADVYKCLEDNKIYIVLEEGFFLYKGNYRKLNEEEKLLLKVDKTLEQNNANSENILLKEEECALKDYLSHEYYNPRYFVLLYSNKDDDELVEDAFRLLSQLKEAHFDAEICSYENLRKMIRYYYDAGVDENEDIVLNSWKENAGTIVFNVGRDENGKKIEKKYHSYAISTMPRQTKNGWLHQLANLDGVKMSLKLKDTDMALRSKNELSSSIMELKMQLNRPQKVFERDEIQWQIDACYELISDLNAGDEVLRDCYIQFLVPEKTNKNFLQVAAMNNLKIDKLYFRQAESYLNCDIYKFLNQKDLKNVALKLPSSIVGSSYVFTYPTFFDTCGQFIGNSLQYPVFFDQFYNLNNKGSNLRVNANISITGTSGVGKSYLSKILLTNMSTAVDKIRILDPENEYSILCKNLYGRDINVSGGDEIINPLQIFPSIDGDEGGVSNDVTLHKQFLEEFFKTCIQKVNQDSLIASYLTHCLDILYARWGYYDGAYITDDPNKYPIMQDLYDVIQSEYQKTLEKGDEYEAKYYKELLILFSSFVRSTLDGKEFEGSKSKMWNGKTTLKLDNRLIVFNFQNLLSSNNKDISAAQMLLVMRFLNQEVILNKNYNEKYKNEENFEEKKIVLMVDEAHNFISKDNPVALSFLYKMSKQIRKYSGSLIVTTQQINDFLGGDEETSKKAKGVIANCQYSFIFGNPNAINEVKNLYGEIMKFTDDEMTVLKNNKRGECLFQLSPSCRTILNTCAVGSTNKFFDNKDLLVDLERIKDNAIDEVEDKEPEEKFNEGEEDLNNIDTTEESVEQTEKIKPKNVAYNIIEKDNWIYYLSSSYKDLSGDNIGKWKYLFNNQEFAQKLCESSVSNNICLESKCLNLTKAKSSTGYVCLYLDSDDSEGHKKILNFMLVNELLPKNKKGIYLEQKFSYDKPFIDEEKTQVKKEIKLSDFIDLKTGEFIS